VAMTNELSLREFTFYFGSFARLMNFRACSLRLVGANYGISAHNYRPKVFGHVLCESIESNLESNSF
jgi:hypothetical protein